MAQSQLHNSEALSKVPQKSPGEIRLLTFNVNGCKTLFNYHPWNQVPHNYDEVLLALQADIVSLQELKIPPEAVVAPALTKLYRAFIALPKSKKGYSGVALYVRRPQSSDLPQIQRALTVVKAEEGMTGRLCGGDKLPYCRQDAKLAIGGYPDSEDLEHLGIDEQYCQKLDSEGRCIIVELANETVVFSLYCPANSGGSEDGQTFRLMFLEVLLRRARKIHESGKKVVLMGDINVSLDLIDNAEYLNELIRSKRVRNNLSDGGEKFETVNADECREFRVLRRQASLLNSYVLPSSAIGLRSALQFLLDSSRLIQGRRLAMYTVWNTQTNSRQTNFGSRIDLILMAGQDFAAQVSNSDIMPYIYGSDHCPVFTDVRVNDEDGEFQQFEQKLAFEARRFFKLTSHRDISTMFGAKRTRQDSEKPESISPGPGPSQSKIAYKSRKKQTPDVSIHDFFMTEKSREKKLELTFEAVQTTPQTDQASSEISELSVETASQNSAVKLKSISDFAALIYDNPPLCLHKDPCILRTSWKKDTKGKKFWCCARDAKGASDVLGQHRCEFFKWARK